MKHKVQTILIETIAALFVLLFVYAAVNKLQHFEDFKVQLGQSPILNAFATITAFSIPPIELIVAAMLMFRKTQFMGLYAAFCLMVIFSSYIYIILKFSPYVPCSCGGILQNMTWNYHFWFNIWFVVLAAVGIWNYPILEKELMAVRGEN